VRPLDPAPASFADHDGPRLGSYAGALPAVTLAPSLRRTKKWLWLGASARDVWISLAIVRTGYAATVFAFAARRAKMIAEHVALGPPWSAHVSDDPHGADVVARGSGAEVLRRGSAWTVRARFPRLALDAGVDLAAPALSVITSLAPGRVSATEKRAPLRLRGEATVDGRALVLDGGRAGFDYTHGHLPRHTRWRWAFGLGPELAFNLTSGFVGGAECARFGNDVTRLAEPTFDLETWTVRGAGIDLRFEPIARHVQRTNLLLVRSRFLQCAGRFTGEVSGVAVDVPGVLEDQDVLW